MRLLAACSRSLNKGAVSWSPGALTLKSLSFGSRTFLHNLLLLGRRNGDSEQVIVWLPADTPLDKDAPFSPPQCIWTHTWGSHLVSSLLAPPLALYLHPAFQSAICTLMCELAAKPPKHPEAFSCALWSGTVQATHLVSHRDLGHSGGEESSFLLAFTLTHFITLISQGLSNITCKMGRRISAQDLTEIQCLKKMIHKSFEERIKFWQTVLRQRIQCISLRILTSRVSSKETVCKLSTVTIDEVFVQVVCPFLNWAVFLLLNFES